MNRKSSKRILLGVFFFLLGVYTTKSNLVSLEITKHHEDTDNYVLIMSQSWTPTVCLLWLVEHVNQTCTITSSNSWNVHGIWLSDKVEGSISYCNDTWTLDIEEIKPIEPQLDRLWKNVMTETARYEFWEHEWIKHGTCSAILKPLSTQTKYFTQGIKWITQHSIYDVLNGTGVVPSNIKGYYFQEIFRALSTKYKVRPKVVCKYIGNNQFVSDIHICFNTSMELSDCVPNVCLPKYREFVVDGRSVLTNCDFSKEILYLKTVPNVSQFLNTSDQFLNNVTTEVHPTLL